MAVHQHILANVHRIRKYTSENPELRDSAHHFLYDKRFSDSETIQYIVMGINPGEPPSDPHIRGAMPLEETSHSDFLKDGTETRPARRWREICIRICGTLDIALTEALFWSSMDVQQLKKRYGQLRDSPHVQWCVKPNEELIQIHNPRAVIFVGIGWKEEISALYQLMPNGPIIRFEKKHRSYQLIAPYKDRWERPWVFFKHWTGARPSAEEMAKMSEFIAGPSN